MSPEFRSLALLYVHAAHFINDCAYGSIGFIFLDMSCECIFYVYMLCLLLSVTWLIPFPKNSNCSSLYAPWSTSYRSRITEETVKYTTWGN